ncbi:hypothetical protein MUP32_04790 [Candidatus Microgenomates bacterium]|nr:hypothetical protein [Candidatus Microgenomates bacterium]
MTKKTSYFLTAIIFFFCGILITVFYQQYQRRIAEALVDTPDEASPTVTPTVIPSPEYEELVIPQITQIPHIPQTSSKYTIEEIGHITTDKTSAETGETVNFTVTIKNAGTRKKFLTHVCFNYTGGSGFGCLLNKNLEAGESFNLNNSMMFGNPGSYSVWITWSQDGINFYRPNSSGTAAVSVN